MITRKKILSAISAMASVMMFAAGPSEAKGENDNREENQAIVAEMARITAPHFAKKDAEKRAAAEAEWQQLLKTYNGQKEKSKSKGIPASVYVLCCLAVAASGIAAEKAGEHLGERMGRALRKRREDRHP